MIKILFLINTLGGGGAEKVLTDLVNNLPSDKYRVTVQTVIDTGTYRKALTSGVRYRSLNRIKIPLFCKIWTYLINFVIPPAWTYWCGIAGGYDYEVAFLEGVPTKLLAAGRNRTGRKYAWVHTDMSVYYGHEKVFRSIRKHAACYAKYDRIFCVSESVKEGFLKLFGEFNLPLQPEVVYNPVDVDAIKLLKNVDDGTLPVKDRFTFVSVGRLSGPKSYLRLLHACKNLRETCSVPFSLWILGEGEEREKLETCIRENALQENVRLLGFHKNPYKYMGRADAFVCSSVTEGFSTVVTEAIVLGIPVVTTDCAGMKEILGDSEYGLIVPNSEEGLYRGMASFLTNPEVYAHYRRQAALRSPAFSLEERMSKIELLFNQPYHA